MIRNYRDNDGFVIANFKIINELYKSVFIVGERSFFDKTVNNYQQNELEKKVSDATSKKRKYSSQIFTVFKTLSRFDEINV